MFDIFRHCKIEENDRFVHDISTTRNNRTSITLSFLFYIPFLIFLLLSSLNTAVVVTRIRGHTAGASTPPPTMVYIPGSGLNHQAEFLDTAITLSILGIFYSDAHSCDALENFHKGFSGHLLPKVARFQNVKMEVSTTSQACLTRETGESGPHLVKSHQPFRETHPTPLAIWHDVVFKIVDTAVVQFRKRGPIFR